MDRIEGSENQNNALVSTTREGWGGPWESKRGGGGKARTLSSCTRRI